MLLPLLLACTTLIRVETRPAGAEVYVTDYMPSATMPPTVYTAHGYAPLAQEIDYYAWENYYVWAGAPGYQASVTRLDQELKVGPAVGGLFCCVGLWIWALGPDDAPVYMDLQPTSAATPTPGVLQ